MRLRIPTPTCSLLSILLLLVSTQANSFDCDKVTVKGAEFHLAQLGGLHQVSWVRERDGPLNDVLNTTFKIDLCKKLKYENNDEGKEELRGCQDGTRICGIERETFGSTGNTETTNYIPIARGSVHDGAYLEPKRTRLKDSESNTDSKKEGLRLQLEGGEFKNKPQKAIIEFLCQRDDDKLRRRDDNEDGDKDGDEKRPDEGDDKTRPEWEAAKKTEDGSGGTIEFLSYEDNTLRLDWRTKYGCENFKGDGDDASDGDGDSGGGGGGRWGFFSWLFFLGFMGLLLYFAVSAWMNYTRYGAQGWDLIPHSDTLRDIPYILGDWWRKIVGTVSGGGSRGGYSAV